MEKNFLPINWKVYEEALLYIFHDVTYIVGFNEVLALISQKIYYTKFVLMLLKGSCNGHLPYTIKIVFIEKSFLLFYQL